MSESIHQFVIDQLELAKGRWPLIAEETGVPLRTIEKIARRETQDPTVSRIEKLERYFRRRMNRKARRR